MDHISTTNNATATIIKNTIKSRTKNANSIKHNAIKNTTKNANAIKNAIKNKSAAAPSSTTTETNAPSATTTVTSVAPIETTASSSNVNGSNAPSVAPIETKSVNGSTASSSSVNGTTESFIVTDENDDFTCDYESEEDNVVYTDEEYEIKIKNLLYVDMMKDMKKVYTIFNDYFTYILEEVYKDFGNSMEYNEETTEYEPFWTTDTTWKHHFCTFLTAGPFYAWYNIAKYGNIDDICNLSTTYEMVRAVTSFMKDYDFEGKTPYYLLLCYMVYYYNCHWRDIKKRQLGNLHQKILMGLIKIRANPGDPDVV